MKSKGRKQREKQYQVRPEVSARMRKVRSFRTEPEQALLMLLQKEGLRPRGCSNNVPGKPDIVFAKQRLAVFVDGDYWHGGQWRKRRLLSLEDQFLHNPNRDYWLHKIRRNMSRDCVVTQELLEKGWAVLRFWESTVAKEPQRCVEMTTKALREPRSSDRWNCLASKTFAEFFAGIGLMRMGLERQGWHVDFANDIDPQKEEMYKSQFPDASDHFILGDIHKLCAETLPRVALATASFPCNDLSLAGARNGLAGKQSSAFWGFTNLLQGAFRPPILLIENVPGFLTSHGGEDFRQALMMLNSLGYDVDTFMLDALHFVPQSRQRLFVMGIQSESQEPCFARERPSFFESSVRPKALADFIFRNPEIRWQVRDLPDPPSSTRRLDDLLEDIPEDSPEWWSQSRVDYLYNQMSERHRIIADRMIAGKKLSYGTVFRRVRNGQSMAELRTDGIAGCLRTPKGGSGRQILFKAGRGKCSARLLSPRECARLMGADDFSITVSLNQALFGFGDAVCVPAVEWITTHYLNPLVIEKLHDRILREDKSEAV